MVTTHAPAFTSLVTWNFRPAHFVSSIEQELSKIKSQGEDAPEGEAMDDNIIGLAAVVMTLGIPLGAMYTFFRVRKLRSEERLAAIARGVDVPMAAELSEGARSRRSGILLVSGAMGYIGTFALIARFEPDAWMAVAFGIIPLAIGVGYFVDSALIRRDAHSS